jgi:t-SNARE complex subunit (syntaxin)
MTQQALFYEDIFDVVRAAVQAAGGAKVVAAKLWTSKPIGQAQTILLDCLNRDGPRKLCIEEMMAILRMAKEAGFHQAKHWIDDALGYERTDPIDPAVERDRLAEQFSNLADAVRNAQRAMERLTVDPTIRAVK